MSPARTKLELQLISAQKKVEKQKFQYQKNLQKLKDRANLKVTKLKSKSEKKSLGQLIDKLDKVFSIYIRTRDSINDYCTCVTCGIILPIAGIQCGHYIKRSKKNTRWDERNAAPQCFKKCNSKISGNGQPHLFAPYLLRRYGPNILYELAELAEHPYKGNRIDLLNKIDYFKAKLSQLNG